MTNYEKYKDDILRVINSSPQADFGFSDGAIILCDPNICKICAFSEMKNDRYCANNKIIWLYDEYKIDWSKVPIDTKILVSGNGTEWFRRHFAKYKNGYVYAFCNGVTSWSTEDYGITFWKYAKLAEEEK